jgi:ribosomal-protein-alanine N-acetyltransferase
LLKANTLHTERLRLERLTKMHLSSKYVEWMNNPAVYEYMESGGNYTIEHLESFLETVEKSDICFWAIIKKNGNEHIGNIKIDPLNPKHLYGEYGIMIGDPNAWGQGFAYEASQVVLEYCFKILKLRKINLGVRGQNFSAIKLYKNLGFTLEGVYKNQIITEKVMMMY